METFLCIKRISPTSLHQHKQLKLLMQGKMEPCCHVVYASFWISHPTWQNRVIGPGNIFFQSSFAQFCPVLSWQEWLLVCSSAALVRLLQAFTCCAFRDILLHILAGRLFELLLPFLSQSSPGILLWPLTSHSESCCCSLDIILNKRWPCDKIPVDQHFLKHSVISAVLTLSPCLSALNRCLVIGLFTSYDTNKTRAIFPLTGFPYSNISSRDKQSL